MIRTSAQACFNEFIQICGRDFNSPIVIGCSTSEVAGCSIGSNGSLEIAEEIWQALQILNVDDITNIAVQCCEHLNRALVIERIWLNKLNLTEVMAMPILRAGGALATVAFKKMKDPVLAESIVVDAAIDIGDTLIGMHIKPVAKPIRMHNNMIGNARVNAAISRPRLIGGERAVYC